MSCLAICKTHHAESYDLFWANEALASVVRELKPSAFMDYVSTMRDCLSSMKSEDKVWCEPRLKELEFNT